MVAGTRHKAKVDDFRLYELTRANDGCSVARHCLDCPLPLCRHDIRGGKESWERNALAAGYTVAQVQMVRHGKSVEHRERVERAYQQIFPAKAMVELTPKRVMWRNLTLTPEEYVLVQAVERRVKRRYKVTIEEVLQYRTTGTKSQVNSAYAAYVYWLKEDVKLSWKQIGSVFGRHHSSMMHLHRKHVRNVRPIHPV